MAYSALSWQSKRTILTQEALRIIRNTSVKLDSEILNGHLSRFMLKLKDSGYPSKFRSEIIQSAKNAFNIQLEKDKQGIRPLFRNKAQILKDSANKKKHDWWNKASLKNPKAQRFNTVLFVPPTPGSKLAKMMRAKERTLNSNSAHRIKILEKGGHKLKDLVVKKNPFPTEKCWNVKCPMCRKTSYTDPGDLKNHRLPCKTPGVGYEVICLTCKEKGKTAKYFGETGRSMVVRGAEHVRDLESQKSSNALVKHVKSDHKNEKKTVKFQFEITKKFHDALSRQANEGVRIFRAEDGITVLNSKSEFHHPPTNRIVIKR